MPMVQIDEAELTDLRNHKQVLEMAHRNPKTHKRTLELLRELDPAIPIPELDATAAAGDVLKQVDERIAAWTKTVDEREAAARKAAEDADVAGQVNGGRSALRKLGYQDDGIKAVEDYMVKLSNEGIRIDHVRAAKLFDSEQVKEQPVTPFDSGRAWNFGMVEDNDAKQKALFDNPKKFARTEAMEVLRELRGAAA